MKSIMTATSSQLGNHWFWLKSSSMGCMFPYWPGWWSVIYKINLRILLIHIFFCDFERIHEGHHEKISHIPQMVKFQHNPPWVRLQKVIRSLFLITLCMLKISAGMIYNILWALLSQTLCFILIFNKGA